eukprot:gene6106-11831_t
MATQRRSPVPTDEWSFLPKESEVTHADITSRAAALSSTCALSAAWDRSVADVKLDNEVEEVLETGRVSGKSPTHSPGKTTKKSERYKKLPRPKEPTPEEAARTARFKHLAQKYNRKNFEDNSRDDARQVRLAEVQGLSSAIRGFSVDLLGHGTILSTETISGFFTGDHKPESPAYPGRHAGPGHVYPAGS